jgi:hypothetical protein
VRVGGGFQEPSEAVYDQLGRSLVARQIAHASRSCSWGWAKRAIRHRLRWNGDLRAAIPRTPLARTFGLPITRRLAAPISGQEEMS